MIKLTRGQKSVLITASVPLAAIGLAGGIASFFNFRTILDGQAAAALSIVVAGEGAILSASLVMLALTLLGQHTPGVARAALWLLPAIASVAGGILAPTLNMKVVMVAAPLAMTVSGEGVTLVARRIVAFQTGVDIEQQRRSGLLLWHANRAANGSGLGKHISKAAVWRLTKQFAATDAQMSVQLGEVQRYRIGEGADANLAAVLSGTTKAAPALPAAAPVKAVEAPSGAAQLAVPAESSLLYPKTLSTPPAAVQAAPVADEQNWDFVKGVLAEAEQIVAADPDPVEPKLLTTAEAAALLGVSPGTVRSWKARGVLHMHGLADRRGLYEAL